jgi:hypothetical protein
MDNEKFAPRVDQIITDLQSEDYEEDEYERNMAISSNNYST